MKWINRILQILLFIPTCFLVLATSYSVFERYWAQTPVHWMEEVSGIALIWIVMVGAIAAELDGEQLSIPLIVDALGERARRVIEIGIVSLSVALLSILSWYGVALANKVAYKLTGVLKVSWFWIDIAVPVGFIGMALCFVFRGFRSRDHRPEAGL